MNELWIELRIRHSGLGMDERIKLPFSVETLEIIIQYLETRKGRLAKP